MANKHILNAMQRTPWAILPEALEEITGIVLAHDLGERLSLSELEARAAGRKLENSHAPYVDGGVGIIPIYGPLVKRAGLFNSVSALTSAEAVRRDLDVFLSDGDIRGIVLDIDSPGGVVDGTKALRDAVFEARGGQKPITAYANGQMTSAAYWIGSAAHRVIVDPSAVVGSIGVVRMHVDYSEADKKDGIKRTFLTAGKYKAIGNDAEPLSKEGREYLQGQLDHLYGLFVDDVAQGRGETVEAVLSKMADGWLFIGEQAVTAGLADEVGYFERALEMASAAAQEGEPEEGSLSSKPAVKSETGGLFNQQNQQFNQQFNQQYTEENDMKEANKVLAEYIGNEALANSDISEEIRASLSLPAYTDFVDDDGAGALDAAAYKSATVEFIQQIEAKITPQPQVRGGASGSRPFSLGGSSAAMDDEEKADAATVDELFRMAEGGKANLDGLAPSTKGSRSGQHAGPIRDTRADELAEYVTHEDPGTVAERLGIAEEDALVMQMLFFSEQADDALSYLKECRLHGGSGNGGEEDGM